MWCWQRARSMGTDLHWATGLLELLKQTIQVCIDSVCQFDTVKAVGKSVIGLR